MLLTGASGGIGHAIANAVADRGGRLIVTGRRGEVLDELIAKYGGRAVVVDLAERQDVERLAKEAGDVDILIANAGLPASGTLESFTVNEIDRALDVNLRAPMMLAKQLAPAMVANGRGHLVFVSSILGKAASPQTAVYSATKYGLRGFAAALREDLRGAGVGVSVVFPGSFGKPACSPTPRSTCRQESAPAHPTRWPTVLSPRSRRTAARSMSHHFRCGSCRRSQAWPRSSLQECSDVSARTRSPRRSQKVSATNADPPVV